MKTFSRLIRRYVLAAAGIIAMLITFTIGLIVWIGWRESNRNMQRNSTPVPLRRPWSAPTRDWPLVRNIHRKTG